jgi:hypothetical protein
MFDIEMMAPLWRRQLPNPRPAEVLRYSEIAAGVGDGVAIAPFPNFSRRRGALRDLMGRRDERAITNQEWQDGRLRPFRVTSAGICDPIRAGPSAA